MSPNDPTPLWFSLYAPLTIAAVLAIIAGICWLIGYLRSK